MFVFDNLIMSDDRSLQTLLRSVDNELLVLALKGADEPLREKLFSCMSKRAAANIMDEMEALGPVRLTEVQTAQKKSSMWLAGCLMKEPLFWPVVAVMILCKTPAEEQQD